MTITRVVPPCSFCGTRLDATNGVLGTVAGICHVCTRRAASLLARPDLKLEQPSNGTDRCDFCYDRTSADALVFRARRGRICVACIDLLLDEVLETPRAEQVEPPPGIVRLWP